uniref:peptidoglycan D,D-transpeptidase FtsI family protein n=1 Tax=Kineosporia sp. R_H_3 TaxID=1961848 RepID=UPI000B4BBE6B
DGAHPVLERLGNPDLRLRLVLVVVFLVMSVLGGRLVQLQGLDSESVAAQALENRMRTVDLPAHRGDITDVNGRLLAWTVERRHILVDQNLVTNYEGTTELPPGLPGAARALAPVLDMDVPTLTKKLSGKAKGAYVKKDVTPEVYRKVRELRIPGIGAEQASRRVYPAQTVGAQIVGFVSKDGRALAGVERIFDPELKGTNGRWTFERSGDKYGAQIPTGVNEEVEPVDGNGVRLTIDQDIQWQAQQILEAQVKATEAETGYVVVMTKTGQILALASAPGFDASDPGASDAADRQNRALTDVFEPGSTSKVVTLAAALEEGVATPTDEITVEGTLRRSDRTFHDAEAHGTEKLTVAGVLAKSSNIGTIKIGEQVPAGTMYDYMRKFGLGAKTGIFGTTRSSATLAESSGILAPPSKWSGSQRYTMMFGQGLAVTALQSADVFATIANDGVRVAPRVVAGTTSPDGVYTAAPAAPQTRVVSAQTARDVRLMLENVVGEEGTARRAEIPGYRVAGKTGTSQYADPTCGCYRAGLYTSSFIGMAPADKPEIVVAVVLQKPKNGYFGGTVAAPVFQQVMSYALTKRQVPPTLTKKPDLPLTWK